MISVGDGRGCPPAIASNFQPEVYIDADFLCVRVTKELYRRWHIEEEVVGCGFEVSFEQSCTVTIATRSDTTRRQWLTGVGWVLGHALLMVAAYKCLGLITLVLLLAWRWSAWGRQYYAACFTPRPPIVSKGSSARGISKQGSEVENPKLRVQKQMSWR